MTSEELAFAGWIAAEQDPPGIPREAWSALVDRLPTLERDGDGATVVMNGRRIGRMCWATDGARRIDVHGDLADIQDVAWNVAAALDAQFVTLAELTSC